MKTHFGCIDCGCKRFWKVRRNHFKCKRCRKEITKSTSGFKLATYQLGRIIHWFALEQSTSKIQEQTNFSKYYILRVLLALRQEMLLDVPKTFKCTVEVDETYLGGQWKNKRLSVKASQ